MAREIKFRLCNRYTDEVEYATLRDLVENTADYDFNYDYYDWSQFTGLKNESGVEIYEGDILGVSHVGGETEAVGEVIFDKDLLAFTVKYTNGGWDYLYNHFLEKRNEGKEVLGNVRETPELLVKN